MRMDTYLADLATHPGVTTDAGEDFYVEGLRVGIDARIGIDILDENDVPVNRLYATRGEAETLRLDVLPRPRLLVDHNRDGQITLDAADQPKIDHPFRFWVNDDDDRLVDSSNELYTELEEDDRDVGVTGTPNWRDNTISCMRDLEEFSRLWINLKGMTDAVRTGQLYVGLRWANTTGDPWIKLYPHAEADGGNRWHSGQFRSNIQSRHKYWGSLLGAPGFDIPTATLP